MSKRKRHAPAAHASAAAIEASRRPRYFVIVGAALITIVSCIVYFPALRGGFIFDDDIYLTEASYIHASDGLYRIWCTSDAVDFYPLTNTTLWLLALLTWKQNTFYESPMRLYREVVSANPDSWFGATSWPKHYLMLES